MDEQQQEDQQQSQNPAVEDEQRAGASPEEQGQGQEAAAQDGANPAAESGNKAAEEENATAEKVAKVNGYIAKGMEKIGGKPGKYIGKGLTALSDLSVEGLKQRNEQLGNYDNKTETDENGNQVPVRQTVASNAADKGVNAQVAARGFVGKYTNNETVKDIAGYAAGGARVLGESVKDTGLNIYQGAKTKVSNAWNRLKGFAGVGNP